MINKVLKTAKKYNMIQEGDKICVALSGGADSVALLSVLFSLRETLKINLCAVHINHCLRGAESDRDEKFVRQLCKDLGIELIVEKIDVNALSKESGDSVELAARKARYSFFETLSDCKIATAHTSSDNAETVLINILRGTALKGLCGIPAKRGIYIRPLIECTRLDVEKYCEENSLSFVTDSSNLSDDYTRNVLRHKVVPVLRNINMSFDDTVRRMSDNISSDCEYIDTVATEIYKKIKKRNAVLLPENLHKAVLSRIIFKLIEDVTGSKTDSLHINEICDSVGSRKRILLFSNYYAVINKQKVEIINENDIKLVSFTVNQKIISKTDFDKNCKINNLLLKNAIDYDKICGVLNLRTRKAGDFIKLNGREGTKDVRKLFNEHKIPIKDRDVWPIACDEQGVIWISEIGISQRVAVDEQTKNVLFFETCIK